MLVKILDADPNFVDELKQLTGSRTAAKAYAQAAGKYLEAVPLLREQQQENQHLKTEVARLRRIIDGARSSASLLLEQTGQGDLLS